MCITNLTWYADPESQVFVYIHIHVYIHIPCFCGVTTIGKTISDGGIIIGNIIVAIGSTGKQLINSWAMGYTWLYTPLSDKRKLSSHLMGASMCFCHGLHNFAVQIYWTSVDSRYSTDSKKIIHTYQSVLNHFKHVNWSDSAWLCREDRPRGFVAGESRGCIASLWQKNWITLNIIEPPYLFPYVGIFSLID